MTKNLLTLEALEALEAIDRKGSFAAAAHSLHKVPSALSYTIQKLEQDLNVTLFQKQGRRSVPTNACEYLLTEGRELLEAARQLVHNTQQIDSGWEPRLRIACDTIIPSYWLYPLLSELYELQPNIEIDITEEVLAGTWEALIENRTDLVIGAVDKAPGHKGIRHLEWFTPESCFVASPSHPITNEPNPLTTDIIGKYRSVIVHDSSKNLPTINRGILNKDLFIHVPSMREKIRAHCDGLGVGMAPRFLVDEALKAGQLVEFPLVEPPNNTPLCIAWKSSNKGQALHWLVEKLQTLNLQELSHKQTPLTRLSPAKQKNSGFLKI